MHVCINRSLTADSAGVGRDDLDVFSGRFHPHAVNLLVAGVEEEQQVGVDVKGERRVAMIRQLVEAVDENRRHVDGEVGDADMSAAQSVQVAVDVHRPRHHRLTWARYITTVFQSLVRNGFYYTFFYPRDTLNSAVFAVMRRLSRGAGTGEEGAAGARATPTLIKGGSAPNIGAVL